MLENWLSAQANKYACFDYKPLFYTSVPYIFCPFLNYFDKIRFGDFGLTIYNIENVTYIKLAEPRSFVRELRCYYTRRLINMIDIQSFNPKIFY